MEKNENKIEKIDEEQEKDIVGGFVGNDWNKKDARIYRELGITHNRNAFKKDTYYIGETKIPSNFAYALKNMYASGNDYARSDALELISRITDAEDEEELNEILEKINKRFG